MNVASIYGRESKGAMTYNASKAALISFSKGLAQQTAQDNIRVNSIAPGSIIFPGGVWERRVNEAPDGLKGFIDAEMPLGPVRPPRGTLRRGRLHGEPESEPRARGLLERGRLAEPLEYLKPAEIHETFRRGSRTRVSHCCFSVLLTTRGMLKPIGIILGSTRGLDSFAS